MFCYNGLYFWLGPIYKLFKYHVNYALMWILRILGPIKFFKGPIKISNGQLKFGNLHVFEWDLGHLPILRAHHHFGFISGVYYCPTVPIFVAIPKVFVVIPGKFRFWPYCFPCIPYKKYIKNQTYLPHFIKHTFLSLWKQCRSRSAGFIEASWSGYTRFYTMLLSTS